MRERGDTGCRGGYRGGEYGRDSIGVVAGMMTVRKQDLIAIRMKNSLKYLYYK